MKPIPYARQNIDAADVAAVTEALNSDWLTQGPAVERFEQAVAAYCGAKYAVAVNSATSALHIACLAAGVGHGDAVWTTPNTFVASANCALYCGADVDFVDIDATTYNMSEAELADKLARAREGGRLPKAVVPVDFSGQSCAMERIAALAQDFGFSVIEDASHAIGATYRGDKIGACRYAAMTVFSFHAVKIITSGEGGMITTNNRELYERLVLLRSHGITRDTAKMAGESHGPWYYEQIGLGYNYRMTDIQAALGASQLARIDEFVARRRALAARYDALLGGLPLTLPWQREKDASAWHLYVVRLKLDKIAKSHRQVFEELRAAGIGVNLHYIPVHTQPYYQGLGFRAGDFPAAERYYAEAISLPMYFGLSDEQQDYVAATLAKVLA
ncbi:MAG: UDP-4-amino-4,6-dideoxy-N-acetyl-beta-L-altrosamine transaminase [Sporomusaceae bacterium]|nr:UDP-4-amino-4,6-dideoxy-N-acetyl-beta-L-altrosamine transaminase [Sporomusaceae bacterium]